MSLTDVWPDWGSQGEQPEDGSEYDPGDNVKARTLNHLWYHLRETFSDVETEITSVEGDLEEHETDTGGVHGVDDDDSVAPQSDVDVNSADISDLETAKLDEVDYAPVTDVDAEVTDAATSVSGLDTQVSTNVSDIDALETDLSTLEYVDLSDTGTSFPIPNNDLSNATVTVAGNSVSLGGSTGISHSDLSEIGSDDHHTRYADSEAISAINAETLLDVNISGDADTIDGIDSSGLAKRNIGVEHDVYASEDDVPDSITVGEVVHIDGDGLYVEK